VIAQISGVVTRHCDAGRSPQRPAHAAIGGRWNIAEELAMSAKLCEGLEKTLAAYETSADSRKQRLFDLYRAAK
jgi:hypothetical protein